MLATNLTGGKALGIHKGGRSEGPKNEGGKD
jgi:hypothetical protein